MATDTETARTVAPAVADPTFVFKFEGLPELTVDCSKIPADARLDLLKGAVREYIRNRVNQAQLRHGKDDAVTAWTAYNEAVAADPLQSAVPQPTVAQPAADALSGLLTEARDAAIEALNKGEIKRKSGDPGAGRARKDPLVAMITKVVVKEVYDARRATDPKYSFLTAQKEVGTDGLAYLNGLIESKVAAGQDRGPLEKMRDARYVNPCKQALGLTKNNALKDLPSIL